MNSTNVHARVQKKPHDSSNVCFTCVSSSNITFHPFLAGHRVAVTCHLLTPRGPDVASHLEHGSGLKLQFTFAKETMLLSAERRRTLAVLCCDCSSQDVAVLQRADATVTSAVTHGQRAERCSGVLVSHPLFRTCPGRTASR